MKGSLKFVCVFLKFKVEYLRWRCNGHDCTKDIQDIEKCYKIVQRRLISINNWYISLSYHIKVIL